MMSAAEPTPAAAAAASRAGIAKASILKRVLLRLLLLWVLLSWTLITCGHAPVALVHFADREQLQAAIPANAFVDSPAMTSWPSDETAGAAPGFFPSLINLALKLIDDRNSTVQAS